jgi:hypothetical protein
MGSGRIKAGKQGGVKFRLRGIRRGSEMTDEERLYSGELIIC